MSKNLFITGTGTDIGKTYVTALMIKKLNTCGKSAAYYKAAMSGNLRGQDNSLIPGDAMHVKSISGIAQPISEMCPYIYETAVSPHLASRLEGNPVQMEVVKRGFDAVSRKYDYLTMEGSGGIICPICFDECIINLEDIIKAFKLTTVIIAEAGLGTINRVVLTVEYMKTKGIPIKGIIFNHFHPDDIMESDNIKMCEQMTGLKALAFVKDGDEEICISEALLLSLYE